VELNAVSSCTKSLSKKLKDRDTPKETMRLLVRNTFKHNRKREKKKSAWHAWINLVLVLFWLTSLALSTYTPGKAISGLAPLSPQEQAQSLLETMTPQERVGQLFMVTFNGTDVGSDSQIYDLIVNHHVGGVVFKASQDNIKNSDHFLQDIQNLTRQMQTDSWTASQQIQLDPNTGQQYTPKYVPLLIATSQEGDGYPYDQIMTGTTPLPDEMALGATWNSDLAFQVGDVLGKELAALGINMLIGPSLDVLESPHVEGSTDLGTRTFGGDPYWVGKMGKAYISGVHKGSNGKVAVVATHFPGYGASDRLPEQEVATVRKSLDQLKSFDLQPFFDVTGNAPSPEETTDALLVSNIRYQGFQGNIRLTTRPLSFDPQAFSQLMALPALDAWRQNGGVMVSDDLGSQAIRRYYDLTSQSFDMPRRVALNAFQAGNDLLYVSDFSSGDLDSYTAAVRTLDNFTQKYRDDTFFAQRVDASVLRILTLKMRLYGDFSLGRALATPGDLGNVGTSSQVTLDVAKQAATLISPSPAELEVNLPDPPNLNDYIVFITDSSNGQQCSTCKPFPLLDVYALQNVVLHRYGPSAGGQVLPSHLSSYSIKDLSGLIKAGKGDSQIEKDLQKANWIVFAMLDNNSDTPAFKVLNDFLASRFDLFQQKRLIVFAFNAPYYLDATNISKLSAYYGLYSKTPQFVDVAAYLLFQELRPVGSLPISVMGVYDLNNALFPDPNQSITLQLDVPSSSSAQSTGTPLPPQPGEFHLGDVISVRTGIILDHNGHPVPDGTPVDFVINIGGEATSPRQQEVTTNGIARTTFQVTTPGTIEIYAQTETARSSSLRFDIPLPPSAEDTTLTPTPMPTATPTPTPTPTATLTPDETVAPPPRTHLSLSDWIIAVLITSSIAFVAYRLLAQIGQVRWGVRGAFLALIGGLASYTYLILQMPGSKALLEGSISRGVFLATLGGTLLGLFATWIWRTVSMGYQEAERT
jgi:beta-N-acetylhexosaminidase